MTSLTMRDAFFSRLFTLAAAEPRLWVVSADMGAPALDRFRAELPGQFLNVGIAEAAMATVATGLALAGQRPCLYAIAPFATGRCYEMLKIAVGMMHLPLVIVGVGGGLGYADSGPTHYALDDLALMRAIPHLTIFAPRDAPAAAACADWLAQQERACYLRFDRAPLPVLSPPVILANGLQTVRTGRDAVLFAHGAGVHLALQAADQLAGDGIAATVVDLFRLKPLPEEALVELCSGCRVVATVEEHLPAGSLGEAVAACFARNRLPQTLIACGTRDDYRYAYGGRECVQQAHGLDPAGIAASVRNACR